MTRSAASPAAAITRESISANEKQPSEFSPPTARAPGKTPILVKACVNRRPGDAAPGTARGGGPDQLTGPGLSRYYGANAKGEESKPHPLLAMSQRGARLRVPA